MTKADACNPGWRSFLNAICLQAMTDYFILYRMGAVKECEVTGKFKKRADGGNVYQQMQPIEVPDLLEFLFGGGMSRIMALMGHYSPPLLIKKRILHLESSGEWRTMFGQGLHTCPKDFIKDGRRTNRSAPLATASGISD